ncbi:aminopeptidase N [Nitrincola iocasae]|uniref:Aminopeptidase N n=1 Tax=Nitrincola iocasae TaxID=2614693 RepID=A0A5J6LCY4_9GAMM|nr:aminopeptidase N [Nitrincola iocasae]QEW06188.1 aminopeptidase N [Nitrincola iocasae]
MSVKPVIYLKDYTAPKFQIDSIALRFDLEAESTRVTSLLKVRRHPDFPEATQLQLDGHESLELVGLRLNGQVPDSSLVRRQGEQLLLDPVPEVFDLEIETRLYPAENTALEGLYLSDDMYCTQCEAEGFRRITFYPDRPDVMSVFSTTLVADKARFPILLSNGNPVEQGDLDGGRHWVTWQDPFPKPAYLFALVAGDLSCLEDHFITASGRRVALQIYAERKDLEKLEHAMTALKNAMRWDEQVYGREYDLDIYMIVAVDFFNMGAMENKGLNIFNTACVLAHPRTTTDAGFQRVESVVAHEYFHNWSGNRVTCRDWFQLSLKEGFTVFRDQSFSADMHSAPVQRVDEVAILRTAQFAEDAGPMAHPVRPASFIEISNFYTLTVYEKGAAVVRMLHTLLGAETFRKGTDLYFDRHDGQAVTTDDFVKAMEDVSGRDLTQFKRWYSQAGTPRLEVTDEYDAVAQRYLLTVRQSCPPTPEQSEKVPFHLPLSVGLLRADGQPFILATGQTTQLLEVTQAEQTFCFDGIDEQPLPSLLRDFSAPVKLSYAYTQQQLRFLLQHDEDGFNRWDAGQQLSMRLVQQLIESFQRGEALALPKDYIDTWKALLQNASEDPAMSALLLTLPSEAYISENAAVIDPVAIHHVRQFMRKTLAEALESSWLRVYQQHDGEQAYSPEAAEIARRSLRNTCLGYLMALDSPAHLALAQQQFETSDNMTDQFAALVSVAHSGFRDSADDILTEFLNQWQHESLVMNQWLMVQSTDPRPGALSRVKQLLEHPVYDSRNPNKIRAVIAAFCQQNAVNFHAEDASGYRFLADHILLLDKQNPQIAARLLTPLTRWRRYAPARQAQMQAQLQRIIDTGNLSGDVYEVVSKSLK